jgi:replicative DNA helicase
MLKNTNIQNYNENTFGKLPPQAINVEEALLGGLINEPEEIGSVMSFLCKDAFYKDVNAIIYAAIIDLFNKGKSIDVIVLQEKLRSEGKFEECGGYMYLTSLLKFSSLSYNIEHYARIIHEKYIRREIIRQCTDLIQKSFDDTLEFDELINNLNTIPETVEKSFAGIDSGSTHKEVAKSTLIEIYSDVEKAKIGTPSGITTGLLDLNRTIGGFKPATLIYLAARPGIGKTSLALHFAIEAAKSGVWVNFFSYEMTKNQLFKIHLSGESEVNRTNIRDGKLSENELTAINKAVGRIENLPILWNTKQLNINQVKGIVRKNIMSGRCDIVIIDYLQLIPPTDSKNTREQQISEISRNLKLMSLEYQIPIIALSQLNRLAETEIPRLHHLRESGSLEQDADIVIFPFRELDANQNELNYDLIIAKNRNGSIGRFGIWHNEEMTKFGNKVQSNSIDYNYNPNSTFDPDYNPF